jgi:spoIIIJ-associated protein
MFFEQNLPHPGPALRYLTVMPIDDLQQAAQKIAGFLNSLNQLGGLRLKYRISAGESARDAEAGQARQVLNVELAGPDVPLVIQHNGELLRALETLAAQILRLDRFERHLVSFDAGNFKALRAEELKLAAETAAEKVRQTGVPYSFPPMNSRERRMLHMVCRDLEGVETASVGEGPSRFLVIFPEGKTDLPVKPQVKPRSFGRR